MGTRFEVIGEAASKVSPKAKQVFPGVPWRDVIGVSFAQRDEAILAGYRATLAAIPALKARLAGWKPAAN